MSNRIPAPWTPISITEERGTCQVNMWGRSYTHAESLLPTSLITQGEELLYAPMRLTGMANGEAITWEDEHCYVLASSAEKAEINTFAQSECLIANTTFACEFDGGVRWDIKIMPRGKTVPQVFGVEPCPIKGWDLTELRLEIPLQKALCPLYICYNGSEPKDTLGQALPLNGRIPESGMTMGFAPLLWVGNEKLGLQLAMESDETWQYDGDAMSLRDMGDHYLVTLNLLESRPRLWEVPDLNSCPICFTLGLIATPVKPFDKSIARLRSVHIDCFTKVNGDYWDFLNGPIAENSTETVLDRLERAGVELLILHEKWNTIQNYWRVPEYRAKEIHQLVDACHQRGIKVIPYFGYEVSTAMPEYASMYKNIIRNNERVDQADWMWYRTPWQLALRVCYNSEWATRMVQGVLNCIDEFSFDGMYFDGLTHPAGCNNLRHGCGYLDADGVRHKTYPVFAVREMLKKIYIGVHERGGIINPHVDGTTSPIIYSFSDMLWDGEHIQTAIRDKGAASFSLEYFRAEYLGTNMGVPVQFIVYEFPPVWTFDKSLSLALIHGVYPRPNSVWHPLDVMERIWQILDRFGIERADFHGYWEKNMVITVSDPIAKVSYYERRQADGFPEYLVYLTNPTENAVSGATLIVPENSIVYDMDAEAPADTLTFDLEPYALRIFTVR